MVLRAVSAEWFEALVPRECLARATEHLARTGVVQLETADTADPDEGVDLSALNAEMTELSELTERYAEHWPEPVDREPKADVMLETVMREALGRVRSWASEAEPRVRRLEVLRRERHDLRRLRDFLRAVERDGELDLARLAKASSPYRAALFVLSAEAELPRSASPVVYRRADTETHTYLLVYGRERAVQALADDLAARKARPLSLPDWLPATPDAALSALDGRLRELDATIAEERERLDELGRHYRLAQALGDLQRVRWMLEHLSGVPVSEHLGRITGWTSDRGGGQLRAALAQAEVPALVHFPAPPSGRVPPTLSRNPSWVRPFEIFARLAGTPGHAEADPSRLVAVVAPVLFGYMFADVGHGAVLIAVGAVGRRYLPVLGLLIPGGVMAMLFGVLFGSLFAHEDVIPALWLHPIEEPLPVLIAPLVVGGGLIVLGLALGGLTAHWHRQLGTWLRVDSGVLLIYVGALASIVWSWAPAVAGAGLVWYIAGSILEYRQKGAAATFGAVAELAERLLQLAVNTLSFVRVGAFALAHAGLALAVVSLGAAAGGWAGSIVVQVIGNAAIIALEGLVVGVQTTRLILFEFFIRFLHGEGRAFEPTPPPAARRV